MYRIYTVCGQYSYNIVTIVRPQIKSTATIQHIGAEFLHGRYGCEYTKKKNPVCEALPEEYELTRQ